MAHTLGGEVTAAQEDTAREYGKTDTFYNTGCKLFKGLPEQGISWMSHGDYMAKVPEGFSLVAHTEMCPTAAIADEARGFYGCLLYTSNRGRCDWTYPACRDPA